MGLTQYPRQLHRAGPDQDRFRAGVVAGPGAGASAHRGDAARAPGRAGRCRRPGGPSGLAGGKFRIEGHTDTVGTKDGNKALSDARAKAVADYLASTYRVDPSKLEPVGMGEDELLVKTPAQTPEARNRRVVVVNLGG